MCSSFALVDVSHFTLFTETVAVVRANVGTKIRKLMLLAATAVFVAISAQYHKRVCGIHGVATGASALNTSTIGMQLSACAKHTVLRFWGAFGPGAAAPVTGHA